MVGLGEQSHKVGMQVGVSLIEVFFCSCAISNDILSGAAGCRLPNAEKMLLHSTERKQMKFVFNEICSG